MSGLTFSLFGKFSVQRDSQFLGGLDAAKEQELLSYLLIHRDRPHPRETLASLLWGETSTERSKKYLRQALWHLQNALNCGEQPHVLSVDHDWVQLNLKSELWLDVAQFEHAHALSLGVPGRQLSSQTARVLEDAVQLYKGDLLDGWYQDWCLFERERLQNMYLTMLDKLLSFCEEHGDFENGYLFGLTILRYDRAHERTYRQLMHMQYLAGDRTGALRQYERCVAALQGELGVKPERRTSALYEQILADCVDEMSLSLIGPEPPNGTVSLSYMLSRFKQLQTILAGIQRRLQQDINAVEIGLKTKKR
jgi:DNA-binding SARP family transcriptional activator